MLIYWRTFIHQRTLLLRKCGFLSEVFSSELAIFQKLIVVIGLLKMEGSPRRIGILVFH